MLAPTRKGPPLPPKAAVTPVPPARKSVPAPPLPVKRAPPVPPKPVAKTAPPAPIRAQIKVPAKPVLFPEFGDLPDIDDLPEYSSVHNLIPVPTREPEIEEIDADEPYEIELVPLEELHSSDEGTALVSDDDIRRLLSAGLGEAEIAVKLNTTFARVAAVKSGSNIHTTLVTQSMGGALGSTFVLSGQDAPLDIANPRQVFMRSLVDFQECLQIAMTEYKNNPDSETNHAAMNGFMKTIDGMYKSMEKLGDPAGQACDVVKRVVAPHMKSVGTLNIRVFKMILDEIGPTLTNSFQRTQLEDGLKDALKKLQANTRDEYNRAVRTTAEIFNVNIDNMLMKPGPVSGDFQ